MNRDRSAWVHCKADRGRPVYVTRLLLTYYSGFPPQRKGTDSRLRRAMNGAVLSLATKSIARALCEHPTFNHFL